ncbi:hypothetical protein BDN67DRAFT_1010405 [Paxillus ammoniavirescens]|nr:hypothetical protein BDN67DRAFT_1010405 [Paxillus ammoniavirescens]
MLKQETGQTPILIKVYSLPSSVLTRILGHVFTRDNLHPICALLVNKRLYALAKPCFLTTIFLRSEIAILQLLRALSSDLASDWSRVQVIEFLFSPALQRVRLVGPDGFARATPFSNLRTVRFLFNEGLAFVPSLTDWEIGYSLAPNAKQKKEWLRTDSPAFKLLSIQNPRRFEWFSADPPSSEPPTPFYLVNSHGFSELLETWSHLTSVHLHGVCLLEFDAWTYSFVLPVVDVRIVARASTKSANEAWFFFAVSDRLQGSHLCQRLVLEIQGGLIGSPPVDDVARLHPDTMLSLVGFSDDQRRVFKAMFPIDPLQDNDGSSDVGPGEVDNLEKTDDIDATAPPDTVVGPVIPIVRRPQEVLPVNYTTRDVLNALASILILGSNAVVFGMQMSIRAVNMTTEDLRTFLKSWCGSKTEPTPQVPLRYRFGIPFIMSCGISLIFTVLLTIRTLLVLACSGLSEMKTSLSPEEPSQDSTILSMVDGTNAKLSPQPSSHFLVAGRTSNPLHTLNRHQRG